MNEEDIPTEAEIRDLGARIAAKPRDQKLRLQLVDALYRRGEFEAAINELDLLKALSESRPSETHTSPNTKRG